LASNEEDLKFGKTLSLQVDAITDKVYVVFHLYAPFMFFSQLSPLTCKANSFFEIGSPLTCKEFNFHIKNIQESWMLQMNDTKIKKCGKIIIG
jgi:hypothetical protein